MKKSIAFCTLLTIIIFIPLAFAASTNQTFHTGNATVVSGKTITLKYVESNMVIFEVDGFSSRITLTSSFFNDSVIYSPNFSISGVAFRILDLMPSIEEVRAEIKINFICGNSVCESNETGYCCKDCNCSTGYSCLDNQCIETSRNKCLNDSNCNDSNACTTDSCIGIPRECNHTLKVSCTNISQNASNQSITNQTNSTCNAGCLLNAVCFSVGTEKELNSTQSYCSETGWQAKKPDNSACKNNYECQNKCINEKCSKEQKTSISRNNYILIGAIVFVLIILLIVYSRMHKSGSTEIKQETPSTP